MAGNLLMSISQDERKRTVFRSRRMYRTDRESDIATAEDRGEQRNAKGILELIKGGYTLEQIKKTLQEKINLQ